MAEPDSSDPKLREFLQVMGSARENPLADVSPAGGEVSAEGMIPQAAVPEGESDDEYEQIPSRREKLKSDAPTRLSAAKAQPPAPPAPSQRVEGKTEQLRDDPEGGTISGDHKKPETADPDNEDAPQATDDDWLRSRTNRLLDLVDPEDLPLEPTGDTSNTRVAEATVDQQEPQEAEKPRQEAADETANDKMEVDEPEKDSTVESIRRTSRLFIRNLAYGATEDDIRECFKKFGTIEEVRLSVTLFFCFSSPCQGRNGFCDEPQIGTAYTSVYDANPGRLF